jgi:PAS domain S-box-containing protein
VVYVNRHGTILDVNERVEDLLGFHRDEIVGKKISKLGTFGIRNLPRLLKLFRTGISEGESDDLVEIELTHRDGTPVFVEVGTRYIERDGKVEGAVNVLRDITERKQVEEALEEREEKMRSIFRAAPIGIGVVSDRVILDANDQLCDITGYSRDELIGQSARMAYPSDEEFDYVGQEKYRQIEERGTGSVESRFRRKDGEIIDVLLSSTPLDQNNLAAGVTFTVLDITARKRAERELQAEKEFTENVLDALVDTVFVFEPGTGRPIRWNQAFNAVSGYSDKEILKKKAPDDWYSKEDLERAELATQMVLQKGRVTIEMSLITKDGTTVPTEYTASLLSGPGDEQRLVTVGRDLTERKRAEDALRESEERYRQLFEMESDAIFLIDNETGQILEANRAASALYGYSHEELLSKKNTDLSAEPEETQRVTEETPIVADNQVLIPLRWHRKRDGTVFPVEITGRFFEHKGRPVHVAAIRDTTERRQMQAQLHEHAEHLEQLVQEKIHELDLERAKLVHTSRLAALGQMATGVAHELNQPLTAILLEGDYLKTLAQRSLDEASPVTLDARDLHRVGEDITADVGRCTRIIDHLRTFGRISEQEPTPIDLNQIIEDSFILVGRRLQEHGVEVKLRLGKDLPPILADVHRLEQVILNLITNAEYGLSAMARRVKDGEVDLVDYRQRLEISTYLEGEDVVARVRDNGIGIPKEDKEHIFEPFFTTKPVGEGTGLGLSISYGIVTGFGGEITFESAENEGTIFTLRFPAAENAGA